MMDALINNGWAVGPSSEWVAQCVVASAVPDVADST